MPDMMLLCIVELRPAMRTLTRALADSSDCGEEICQMRGVILSQVFHTTYFYSLDGTDNSL